MGNNISNNNPTCSEVLNESERSKNSNSAKGGGMSGSSRCEIDGKTGIQYSNFAFIENDEDPNGNPVTYTTYVPPDKKFRKGGGMSERSINNSSTNLMPMKSILKKPSCGNANSIPITNGFNQDSNRIDILFSVNSLIFDVTKNTHHGILYEEDMCNRCRPTGEVCKECKDELSKVRGKDIIEFEKREDNKNEEFVFDNFIYCNNKNCNSTIKFSYINKSSNNIFTEYFNNSNVCTSCINSRKPIKKGERTSTIKLSPSKTERKNGKTTKTDFFVPLFDGRIIKKSKVFKILSEIPIDYFEFSYFFKVGLNIDVTLRLLSKTKLSKDDVQDALKFFNTHHSVNTFYAILDVQNKIEFKPKLTTIDEIEKYSNCKYLPSYKDIDVKRFDILGVDVNFHPKLYDEFYSCKQDLKNTTKKLSLYETKNSKLNFELEEEKLKTKEQSILLKKEKSEKEEALFQQLRAESERDAALLELSKKADKLIQLRKEILEKGNIKIGLNTLCEGDKSSSSPCTIQTFFQLFIFFLTLMKIYITIDVMGDPSRIRLKKKPSGDNTDKDLDC